MKRQFALVTGAVLALGTLTAVNTAAETQSAFTAEDARALCGVLLGKETCTKEQAARTDLNADGILNAADLTLLKRALRTDPAQPLWCDEFDGDTLDRTKWNYELGNWKLDADGNYITNGWAHSICSRSAAAESKSAPAAMQANRSGLQSGCCPRTVPTAAGRHPAKSTSWRAGAARPKSSAAQSSAAVEDDGIGADLCEPLDGEAFLVFLRIAAGDEHHVDGGAGVEAHFAPVEVAGHDGIADADRHGTGKITKTPQGNWPVEFKVDYVRVYDKGSFTPTETTSLPLEAYIEGAEASLTNKDGETVIAVQNAGSLEYAVMGLLRGQKLRAGETYTVSFDAASTVPRTMIVTVEDAAYTRYLNQAVSLTETPQHFSFDVTLSADMTADLKFQLGNIEGAAALGAHTVTLGNIRLSLQDGQQAPA